MQVSNENDQIYKFQIVYSTKRRNLFENVSGLKLKALYGSLCYILF